jgi:hypothetical protein
MAIDVLIRDRATLQLLSARIYGDASYCPAVARHTDLGDFRR